MNSLHISIQNEDPSTMTALSSLPEHMESIEESVRLTPSRTKSSSGGKNLNPLEESWNGLFLQSSCSDLASSAPDGTSNKKMGHASFTDLGLYAQHHPNSANNNNKLTHEDIQAAKSQLMKMRLERLLKSKTTITLLSTNNNKNEHRLHQSDSALLRKNSDTDTTELNGTWYRAKHPRRGGSLAEQLAQSAPTGSWESWTQE